MKKILGLQKRHQLLCSVIIIMGLVGVWRGVWGLFDLYLLPQHPVWSYTLSVLLGVGVLAAMHYHIDNLDS